MTFGLRSLGARSSGRKEPSGRRHRLQTAMASLPQNESMGKILRDVCCKLLSSALLRSDGESVFMLTAQSGDVRFFCSLLHLTTWSWNWTWCCGSNWARELRAKQSQMAQKAETKTWSEQGEFTVHSSNFWTCLVPDLDLAPPSSLGFLTVSQRHCQSAEKKKNGRNASRSVSTCPEIHGIRKRGAPIVLITSHHTKQKKEPGATALQPLQDDQPLPAFPEHCTLGPGGGGHESRQEPGVCVWSLVPPLTTPEDFGAVSRHICCICSQNPTTKKLYKREETYQKSPEIKMERNSRLSHNWPRMVMQRSGSCQHGTKCRITHWVLRAVSDAPNKLWSQGFAWSLPCYK